MEAETAKININTIARLAKVSTSTVSSFINGTEVFPFSPETRLRVKEAMRELNYRPHIGGILMRRSAQRRGKVGFVMGEDCCQPVLRTAANPLVQRFLCDLEDAINTRLNMSLEILRIDGEDSRQRLEHTVARTGLPDQFRAAEQSDVRYAGSGATCR